jgi:radical SAM protein with 4Fe4S-binding SPASM domain
MENNLKVISWNITRRCNLRCAHCYLPAVFRYDETSDSPGSCELTTREALRLIDQIAAVNEEVMLILSGGEPLLRSDIYELAEYASGRGMMVVIGTNGYFIDENIARTLKEKGVSGVSVSLDSVNAEIHDDIRQKKGSWDRAVKAIEICKRVGLSVQMNTVVTSNNYDEMPELVQYARSLGVRVFSPFFLVCTGKGEELTDITPEQYEELLLLIGELQEKRMGMMIRTRCAPTFRRILYQRNPESSLLKLEAGKCMAGTSYCRITPEGKVTSCPYMQSTAGNVRVKSFQEIWNKSGEFTLLRNPCLLGKCGACEFRLLCGGCRARAYATHDNMMEEDPWCAFTPHGSDVIDPPVFNTFDAKHISGDSGSLVWTKEAEGRLKKVPFFVRSMVRGAVERYAVNNQHNEITPEIMQKARQNYGMEKMARR